MMDVYRTRAIGIYADEYAKPSEAPTLRNLWGSATRAWEALAATGVIRVNLGKHFFGGAAEHSHQIVYDAEQILYLERAIALSEERVQANKAFFQAVQAGGDVNVLEAERDMRVADLTAQIALQDALLPKGDEQISVAGVLLHEVSHNAVGTTDHVVSGQAMYGPNFCSWLARTNPAKTVDNADSYRLFCEQFL